MILVEKKAADKAAAPIPEPRGDYIMRFPEVSAKVNRPRSSIYLMISQGLFPKPVKIGARAVGWRKSTIDQWLASLA